MNNQIKKIRFKIVISYMQINSFTFSKPSIEPDIQRCLYFPFYQTCKKPIQKNETEPMKNIF